MNPDEVASLPRISVSRVVRSSRITYLLPARRRECALRALVRIGVVYSPVQIVSISRILLRRRVRARSVAASIPAVISATLAQVGS